MSVITANVARLREPARLRAASPAPTRAEGAVVELPLTTWVRADVTVAATVLAVLAILSMFTVFATIAGAMPVVAFCALASLVISVSSAFYLLRRAGI